jgi:hypothetical protein
MRELDVRRSLHQLLDDAYPQGSETRIVDEFPVCSGQRRVDVAVVNGELAGYEIKSDVDKLLRLAGQSATYAQVFDRMWLVVGQHHCDEAMAAVPDWWGVHLAEAASGRVVLTELRTAERNRDEQDPVAIARLLWRDEALALLDEFAVGDRKLRRGSKRHMHTALADALDLETLKARVRATLQARQNWRA